MTLTAKIVDPKLFYFLHVDRCSIYSYDSTSSSTDAINNF